MVKLFQSIHLLSCLNLFVSLNLDVLFIYSFSLQSIYNRNITISMIKY